MPFFGKRQIEYSFRLTKFRDEIPRPEINGLTPFWMNGKRHARGILRAMAESQFDDCQRSPGKKPRRSLIAASNPFELRAGGTGMVAGRGLGIITTSSFDVPQVNAPASVAALVTPAAIQVNVNPATNGEKTGME